MRMLLQFLDVVPREATLDAAPDPGHLPAGDVS